MNEPSSQAVETGSVGATPSPAVPAAVRAERLWVARGTRAWRFALLRRMLALADLTAGLLAGVALAYAGSGQQGQLGWVLVFLPVWIVVAKVLGLYDRDQRPLRHLTVDEAPQIVLWALIGTWSLSLFLELTPAGGPSASSGLTAGVVAATSAFLLRALGRRAWRAATPPERLAVLGPGTNVAAIARKLELFPDVHVSLVDHREALDPDDGEWLANVDRLIFAPTSLDDDDTRAVVELARRAGVVLNVVPPYRSVFGSSVRLTHVAELPVLDYATGDLSRSTLFLKRAMDVTVSLIALAVLWPLFLLIAVAIKVDSRGPVFFSQLRAGQHGRPFRMFKFRSMVADAEERLGEIIQLEALAEPMFKLHDDPRVTRVGHFLRRWSLDELPQLWNVLVGQMSLVGPRPEQIELVDRYTSEQRVRLSLKPGITGPMQVGGRGALTFDERLAVERDYVENLSLASDLRTLGATAAAVLNGRGAF